MEQIEDSMKNLKEEIKDSTNEIENNIQNIPSEIKKGEFSTDNFLFFFNPEVSTETICGLTQNISVKIIGIISLICSISYFLSTFSGEFFFDGLYELLLCILCLIIAFYSFYSALNENSDYAKIAYFSSVILFLIFFIEFLFETLYDIVRFLNIFGSDFLDIKDIFSDIAEGCALLLFLYLVWIIYCFMVNLRNGRNV
jgi:hypothetical protein